MSKSLYKIYVVNKITDEVVHSYNGIFVTPGGKGEIIAHGLLSAGVTEPSEISDYTVGFEFIVKWDND